MPTFLRYTLCQIPGWLLLACLLWWPVYGGWMDLSLAAWIMGLWIVKDAAIYPWAKPAYESGPPVGPRALIGREAVSVTPLTPDGFVRLGGELWSARCAPGAAVPPGAWVRVMDTHGLVLLVEPEWSTDA